VNDDTYAAAQAAAIFDLDVLLPDFQKLQQKILALKLIVRGTGLVLGNYENVPDAYKFVPIPRDGGPVVRRGRR
jgi:hypothetical protein